MASRIIKHFPIHQTYIEPFGGSAAVLLAKEPSAVEVYNDIDGNLVNLYQVLRDRDRWARLHQACKTTLYSKAEFELALQPTDDPVEAARRFIVRQRQSYGGLGERWSYCVADAQGGVSSAVRRWLVGVERLPAIHRRLRKVQIECSDWSEVLERYDRPETLYYLDPPYSADTRVGGGYRHEMNENGHRQLVDAVLSLSGMVVLSGYACDVYRRLERNRWQRFDFDVPCYTSPSRKRRRESLWLSPSALARRNEPSGLSKGPFLEKPLAGMRKTDRLGLVSSLSDTERRVSKAIAALRREGMRVSKAEIGRRTGITREHLSRRYKHLFEER